VINRGNYRRAIFAGAGAAEAFVRTLEEAAVRFGWEVHAYVVMSNHFHLALALTEPNLSHGMKWLQGTWVRRHNGFRGLMGRPFQGRYKALLVEPGETLGKVCHYIHLNPVRARLVKATEAARYPWSSLPKFAARPRPSWLQPAVVLAEAGGLPDSAKGWRKYSDCLAFLAEDEPSKKSLTAAKLSRGWCIGGREFKAEVKREHELRGAELERFAGLEPEVVKAERATLWEERLLALAAAAKVDLGRLPPLKSHPAKVRLAAALKQSTSVSNGWLAKRLQMGQPASASQFVRRWLLREEGRRATKALLSRIKT
jgi:REP element-mobilizing transposase RayT